MTSPETFNPTPGETVELAPGLRRILAPNPSPMTFRGTNTYLLGTRDIAVIDPGPHHMGHHNAILAALTPAQRISHIFVTHTHLDHSPLARPLSETTGAPVLAFGGPTAGRSAIMQELARNGFTGGGEGIDTRFVPDEVLCDGQVISANDWQLEIIHTPGHLGNHICLAWEGSCFTADHVMGWSSSLVSPPDGDLTDFMASCARLRSRDWSRFYPGHGDIICEPRARLDWLIKHRRARETALLAALSESAATVADLTKRIYVDTPATLLPAAERNVFAHLVDLYGKSFVKPRGTLDPRTVFQRASNDTQ